MTLRVKVKIGLGLIALFGVFLQGAELYYKPDAILWDSPSSYQEYLAWIRWLITLGAAIGYLVLEKSDWPKLKKGH